MDLFASVARAVVGMEPFGTLNQTTLSVAFMEFLETFDSNAMKALMLSHGFQDVSPLWGQNSTVPTFKQDSATIRRWPEFQQAMTEVEADWYYVSGHHSRQYVADNDDLDGVDLYNRAEYAGFFNEPYHLGTWEHADRENPDEGRSANDVYMHTGSDWVYDMGPEDNPLFTAPHEDCRGVMLIGCNTLSYRCSRIMWSNYFPNAVVIGLRTRESNAITKVLKLVKEYGRNFLLNPSEYDPEEMVRKLNPFSSPFDMMGILHGGTYYFRGFPSGKVRAIAPDADVQSEELL